MIPMNNATSPVLVSGIYERRHSGQVVETLRLDVDGRYPQMTISGTRRLSMTSRLHWIAELQADGANSWDGSIWFRDGSSFGFLHTTLIVSVAISGSSPSVSVTFSGGGIADQTHSYTFVSPFFHDVEFEFDEVEGTTAVTQINTHDHANRPPTLPDETLTIETAFERAGFRVMNSGGDGSIPLANAGINGSWSDAEMHDAMQTFWSGFDNSAQWSLWVLFAARHDQGDSLGGIMFDDIGPNHRQGTAMFNDSFISTPPIGDPEGDAWVRRMKYWTACHEMGHAFNLAHSWQKALGTPWIPLANQPEVRSFMNYPFRVTGGQTSFFSDFAYRFSDDELLFMRHAPERFVQMGNADWFDNHGFEQPERYRDPSLELHLRVNRDTSVFEFMEPINIELKLHNVSNVHRLVDHGTLTESVVVIIKKRGGSARQWVPFAQRCFEHSTVVLESGDSIYESLFVGAGRNGWDLSEPGVYTIQAALRDEGQSVLSNELTIRIAPPRAFEEEVLAQDFFSDEVGRALAFGGTRVMTNAVNTLHEIVEQFGSHRAAIHAGVALASVEVRDYKVLAMDESDDRSLCAAHEMGARFRVVAGDQSAAMKMFDSAIEGDMNAAADTLGHIPFRDCVDTLSSLSAAHEDQGGAAKIQGKMRSVFAKRNVLPGVLAEIDEEASRYDRAAKAKSAPRRSSSRKKSTTKKAKSVSKKRTPRKKSSKKKSSS